MSTHLDLDDVCYGHPVAAQELATLRTQRDALLAALDCIAERLEAWADAHHQCAMHMPASEDCFAQQNLRDNYRAQANRARAAIARCKT